MQQKGCLIPFAIVALIIAGYFTISSNSQKYCGNNEVSMQKLVQTFEGYENASVSG